MSAVGIKVPMPSSAHSVTGGVGGFYTRLAAVWRKPPQPVENKQFNQAGTGLAFQLHQLAWFRGLAIAAGITGDREYEDT